MLRRLKLLFAVCLWLLVVCFGIGWLWAYNHAAGAAATPSGLWPQKTSVALRPDGYTLVVLAHPKCPCTQATIEELSKLMTHCSGRLQTYVLFAIPKTAPRDWYQTDLWNSAGRIPGVSVMVDEDGIQATRFGALTSGQAMLYDRSGRLLFSGGITQSRGHIGDNAGRSAIESLINQGTSETNRTLVFGCPLFNPSSECRVPNHEQSGK